jgi:peptidoglycan-N-acetylglucosamine deacetylase
MRAGFAIASVLGLFLCMSFAAAQDARVPDNQIAYFQEKNIFHSGLVGTHTIALTFDDGPNANTEAVLDVLKQNGVKATFFIVGKMAKAHPDVLARVAAEGHLLANHSATHPLLGKRYVNHPELLLAQIRDVNDEIAPLMPKGTKLFFRAPYGSWRAQHAAVLNADPVLKFYVGPIYWDIGGQTNISADGYVLEAADWNCWHRHWDADICAKGYMREIRRRDGGIVLMHCVGKKAGELVADVVPALIEEGYRFVRVDQIPAYDKYQTPPETAPLVASSGGRQHVAVLQ